MNMDRTTNDQILGGCKRATPKEFIASDGFHPSPAAYKLWAEVLVGVIRQKWQSCA